MKKLIIFFFIWRIGLFIVAAISPQIIPVFGDRFPYWQESLVSSNLPHFIWAFGNFDGVHYLRIAENGYAYQYTQAFFPVYPLLIRVVSPLTLGNHLLAGLLISNLAFFAALLIFFKLIKQTFDQKIAFWSCLFLLAFPTSFYFGAIYTEGLFFLLLIGFFYLQLKQRLLAAAILAAISSGTRLIGLFQGISVLKIRNLRSQMPLLIAPIGFVAYVLYLKIAFDNPLYFLTSQDIFGQGRSTDQIVLLPQVIYRYFKIMLTTQGLPLANALFELAATVFALSIIIFGHKKIKREWLLFSLLAILTPTLTGTLTSMPRYILVVFPIYIILARIKSLTFKILIISIFVILQLLLTVIFAQGYWVA